MESHVNLPIWKVKGSRRCQLASSLGDGGSAWSRARPAASEAGLSPRSLPRTLKSRRRAPLCGRFSRAPAPRTRARGPGAAACAVAFSRRAGLTCVLCTRRLRRPVCSPHTHDAGVRVAFPGSPAGSALARGRARLLSVRSPLHPAGSLRRPEVLSRSRDPLRGQHHRGRQAARRGAERQLQPGEVLRRPEEQRRQQLPPAVLAVRQPPPAVRRRPGAPAEHRCGGRGLWLARSAARRQGASLSGRLFGEFRFPGRVLHAPGPASLLLRNQMHLLSLRVLRAGVQLRDYVEFSCRRCQNAGGKNLWMPGRTRAHTCERGAACRAEAGPSLPAQRWAGIHHLAAGGGAKEAECAGPRSQGACGPGSYWWTEGGHIGLEHRPSAGCRMRSESRRDCVLGTGAAKRSPQHVLGGRRTASTGPKPPSQGGSEFLGRSGWCVCMHACVQD